jgi:hypothetical protein
VVPSTSGRVVSHQVSLIAVCIDNISIFLSQLSDKVKLFIELKAAVEDYQHRRINTSEMETVILPKVETGTG